MYLEVFEAIWSYLEVFGAIWSNLEQFGPICTNLHQFGFIWTHLDKFGPIWTHLDPFGLFWTILNQFGPIGTHLTPIWPIGLHCILSKSHFFCATKRCVKKFCANKIEQNNPQKLQKLPKKFFFFINYAFLCPKAHTWRNLWKFCATVRLHL